MVSETCYGALEIVGLLLLYTSIPSLNLVSFLSHLRCARVRLGHSWHVWYCMTTNHVVFTVGLSGFLVF